MRRSTNAHKTRVSGRHTKRLTAIVASRFLEGPLYERDRRILLRNLDAVEGDFAPENSVVFRESFGPPSPCKDDDESS